MAPPNSEWRRRCFDDFITYRKGAIKFNTPRGVGNPDVVDELATNKVNCAIMADQHEQLRGDLVELRRQLEATPNLDTASRSLIERVIADVERVLADEEARPSVSTGAAPRGRGSMAGRLAEAAKRFEATHPTLSGTVGSVIDALAQMGI